MCGQVVCAAWRRREQLVLRNTPISKASLLEDLVNIIIIVTKAQLILQVLALHA
jgi:hypothetical protein